jgi:hypothetical protein
MVADIGVVFGWWVVRGPRTTNLSVILIRA